MRNPLIVLDESLRAIFANLTFYRSFKISEKQVVGERIYELGSGQWDLPELRELLETIIPKNQSITDFKIEAEFPNVGRRIFALNGRRVEQTAGLPSLVFIAFEDITNS